MSATEPLYFFLRFLSHTEDLFRVCPSKLYEFKRQIEVERLGSVGYLLRHLPLFFLGHWS